MSLKGIDVSYHNGKIDWQKVKKSGIEFAIIRMGVGSDIESQTDSNVIYNAKECEKAGIPYGLYIYSYALNEQNAHSEAQHMIRIAKQCNASLGYWFDMEDADGYKAKNNFTPSSHKKELTNFCLIFMEDMKLAGFDNVGVYANYDYFKNILNTSELRKVGGIWLAHWGIQEPSMECNIWQYSSDGTVDGISGRADMNIYYGDFESKQIYYDKPEFTLIDALNKIGIDSSYQNRKKIAQVNGIGDGNYSGKTEENLYMLKLLNEGKLKRI